MKAKIYLFRFAVAFAAFICGVGFFGVGRYFQLAFSAKAEKIELASPAPIIVEQAETPVVEQTDVVADSEENFNYEFDANGFYYTIGEMPKGFKDFLEISVTDYRDDSEENDYQGHPIAPEGYLQTEQRFKFIRISISNKMMAFETETIKGVSYKFSGKFLEKSPFWKVDEETPVLEGRLVKSRKGKRIAKSNFRFMWYGGGC